MKRHWLLFILTFCLIPVRVLGQSAPTLDALEVKYTLADSAERLALALTLSQGYQSINTELAIRYANYAIDLAKAKQDSIAHGLGLLYLGKVLQRDISNYDSALSTYFFSKRLLSKTFTASYYETQIAIAETYSETAGYRDALRVLLDAELDLSELNFPTQLGEVQRQLGDLYILLEEWPLAEMKLIAAREVFAAQGDTIGLVQTHLSLGNFYLEQGQTLIADSAFISALALATAIEFASGSGNALLGRGKAAADQNLGVEALSHWQESLPLYNKVKNRRGQAEALWQMGNFELLRGRFSSAQGHLENSTELSLASNDRNLLKKGYESLYNLHLTAGNLDAAREYKDLFIAIGEFVFKEENEREIAELQAKSDIEQKERELTELRIEQEFQESLLKQQNTQKNLLFLLISILAIFGAVSLYFMLRIRRTNQALKRTNQQVSEQKQELEDVNNTKDKFFSIIAHDVKGPLSSLRSFAGLLMNHTDALSKEEIKNLATDLDSSLKNLFGLLENLLTWARSQTGALDFNPSTWELSKVIEETVEVLRPTAEKKEITLTTILPESSEVVADRNMITTVIRNLISNALKFTNSGGSVEILIEPYVDAFEVSIKDNGVGMPEAIKKKLFKVGEKVTQKGTANEKGTGLGLLLCKEFVEKNQGSIWVESEEDKGSTFRFTLPVSAHPAD